MDRIELIKKVLREHNSSAAVAVKFLEKPRKYTESDNLYMREVHFAVEIDQMGTPTMGEIAARLNVTQGAVTQMAARLEKKGYVIRSKDAKDKRVTILSLTEEGKKLCIEHVAYDAREYQEVSDILKEFSDEELKKIIRYEQLMSEIFTNRT